jgi:hypothetical protein
VKKPIIAILAAVIVIALIFAVMYFNNPEENDFSEKEIISVTAEDLQEYRNNIGNSMDIKKSILLIFNTQEECQNFINEHGDADNPLSAGVGIAPQMEDGYYNVVGNSVFETIFDSLQDGEYAKETIEFGGAFCYFKRLENYSVTNNDEDLTEFIRQEKSMERGGEINEENN